MCARLEGARESNQDAGTGAGRVWRTPMKTNYSDLKFHLLLHLLLVPSLPPPPPFPLCRHRLSPLSFLSWGHDRSPCSFHARGPIPAGPAGCFEDDRRKGNSVTRGDKFARGVGVGKFPSTPAARETPARRTSWPCVVNFPPSRLPSSALAGRPASRNRAISSTRHPRRYIRNALTSNRVSYLSERVV